MPQWYKSMVDSVNKKLAEHQGFKVKKEEDFPLVGEDKRTATRLDAKRGSASKQPAAPSKKPASSITMDWIQAQKEKLKNPGS